MDNPTEQQKAEAYVRSQLPELMNPKSGCRVLLKGDAWHEEGVMIRNQKIDNITTGKIVERTSDWEIIGHPIQLQHWLRVLDKQAVIYHLNNCGVLFWGFNPDGTKREDIYRIFHLNLTTGQPETEDDYQAFCNIVGI